MEVILTTFNRSLAEDSQGFWLYGPLLFTAFYFMPNIINFEQLSLFTHLCSLAVFAVFILLYIKVVNIRGDKIIPWLIGITLVIALGTYFTHGTQALFGYVVFIAGYTLTLRKAFFMLCSVWLAIFVSGYVFTNSHPYFLVPALLITAGLFMFGIFTQRDAIHRIKERHNKKQIKQLAEIAERERIARDLHDVIGHSMSSIALKSELAEKYLALANYHQAQQETVEVAALSRAILSDVRQAISGLKKQNLAASIHKLVNELVSHNFTVEATNQLSMIPAELESTVVLILTEAITNIMRHSKGNNVVISLAENEQTIYLTITDNGTCEQYEKGNGLQGIAERCQQFNGTFTITTEQGFSLNISLRKDKIS